METMQIVSVKVASIKDPLRWPLQVFGIVAVRDVLDHKRNIVFQRPRNDCQDFTDEVRILNLSASFLFFASLTACTYISAFSTVRFKSLYSRFLFLSIFLMSCTE
jgi:hypothetical protein